MKDFTWTDQRVDHLRYLWSSGLSAAECARELGGVTRNAVIGKVTRLGISERSSGEINRPKRSTKLAALKEIQTPPPALPRRGAGKLWSPEEMVRLRELRASGMIVVDIAVALGRPFEATKKKLKEAGIRVDEPKRAERTARPFIRQVINRPDEVVSIFDLGMSSCRFSFGEVGAEDFGFCGKPVAKPGDSWCPKCRALVFVPMSNGKRRAA